MPAAATPHAMPRHHYILERKLMPERERETRVEEQRDRERSSSPRDARRTSEQRSARHALCRHAATPRQLVHVYHATTQYPHVTAQPRHATTTWRRRRLSMPPEGIVPERQEERESRHGGQQTKCQLHRTPRECRKKTHILSRE